MRIAHADALCLCMALPGPCGSPSMAAFLALFTSPSRELWSAGGGCEAGVGAVMICSVILSVSKQACLKSSIPTDLGQKLIWE